MFSLNPFKSSDALSETQDLAQKIFGMKRDALARAKHNVAKGKMPAVHSGKPGISTYLACLREICAEQNTPLPIRAMMDLSGQEVSGFAFIEEDFKNAEATLSEKERAQLGLDEEAA